MLWALTHPIYNKSDEIRLLLSSEVVSNLYGKFENRTGAFNQLADSASQSILARNVLKALDDDYGNWFNKDRETRVYHSPVRDRIPNGGTYGNSPFINLAVQDSKTHRRIRLIETRKVDTELGAAKQAVLYETDTRRKPRTRHDKQKALRLTGEGVIRAAFVNANNNPNVLRSLLEPDYASDEDLAAGLIEHITPFMDTMSLARYEQDLLGHET